ncbi:MAG: radical SAM protein [Desulfobacterales bacterium]
MNDFMIRRLLSGGLITNYFCTSRCRHCLYHCSPNWEKLYIDPETAEKCFGRILELGCRSVHIGGGEPMLRPEQLEKVLEIANRVGIGIDYVETNSSWFKDTESAKHILRRLRSKGLGTLLISISPFHNEFIPFSKVKGVIDAGRKVGIGLFPWINDFYEDLSAFEPNTPHAFEEFSEKLGKDYLISTLGRYWVHMGGRAIETFRELLPGSSIHKILAENPGSCKRQLSDTTHFHVDLFGNYIPGLCSGIGVRIEDLGKPFSKEEYPVLTTLAESGIRGLHDMAHNEYAYQPKTNHFLNKCDLCTRIRKFLVNAHAGSFKELAPFNFYSEMPKD